MLSVRLLLTAWRNWCGISRLRSLRREAKQQPRASPAADPPQVRARCPVCGKPTVYASGRRHFEKAPVYLSEASGTQRFTFDEDSAAKYRTTTYYWCEPCDARLEIVSTESGEMSLEVVWSHTLEENNDA